ncbi:MAG: FHA domain-containing protein [Prevotella sp.]|nr:FHA domain-containing protein [Prevotella sp.]
MPIYIITCPICKKQYKLTPKDPSALTKKNFTCPNCHYTTSFTVLIKELNTQHPSNNIGDTGYAEMNQKKHLATKISQNIGMQQKAYITIIGTNAKFVIDQGVYILGRKSSDSTATLQLSPDISMSRQHARLTVQIVGGKLMAQIIGLKTNNPIFVNGKVYMVGQPCTLRDGDKIQLGMTKILFSI